MPTESAVSSALAFYASLGAALFPIPAGQKNPTGIVGSFALDCSTDPAQWHRWQTEHPGCNFGLVAGPSRLVIVDTDASTPAGRDAAWSARCALFAEWGVNPATHPPHVQSARGGWHDIFQVPEGIDARALRQPDAIKDLINIRAGNGFVVAAGSYYDGTARGEQSGHYILLGNAAPHAAPATLIEHCTRRVRAPSSTSAKVGKWDLSDVTALYKWLADADAFTSYEDWLLAGMVAKAEFGDAGFDLWGICHDGTVTDDIAESKWNSFSDEPGQGGVALGTILARAHAAGWKGTVRQSTSAMFGTVQAIAHAAGASLPGAPAAVAGMPMLQGQAELARVGAPDVEAFLANTSDVPHAPIASDVPALPDNCSGHGLYESLQLAISRVLAMAEQTKGWKPARVVDAMALLSLIHVDTYDAVRRRVVTSGVTWPESKIKLRATAYEEHVKRACTPQDSWHYDQRGEISGDNSDNVQVYLEILGIEIRWNGWTEQMEIRGGSDPVVRWSDWTYVDDTVVAKLRTRANRTGTRFRPGKEFFWESLLALAHANTIDPACDAIAALAAAWDGAPRLDTWLSVSCGAPLDAYHKAVARNIIGGMVKRARHPGAKHDTMAVLYGFQGSGKSTLAALLAPNPAWFTDAILLGTESKELVLALAGKMVVEIGEMGMRGGANPAMVKKMLSAQFDEGRTAYARAVSKRPRRNIFLGTTNEDSPLSDPTGNRRFLPVRVDQYVDLAWLRANIGQIVGEAAVAESKGDTFDIPREVWGEAAEAAEAARQESDTEIMLNAWFALTEHTQVAYITAMDLAQLAAFAGWRSNASRGHYMRKLGFRQDKPYINGTKTDVWVRGPKILPRLIEREGVRYLVGKDTQGRPTVTIRSAPPVVPGVAPA